MARRRRSPQNGQNVHGFQVRTPPVCHTVPVSRAYGGGGGYFEAPRSRNFACPPLSFIRTLPLEGCFQGWGVYKSGTSMTGRPGHRAMETDGRSTVSYLVRAPRVAFLYAKFNTFMLSLIGLEAKGLLASRGDVGSLLYGGWNLRPVIFGQVRKVAERKFLEFFGIIVPNFAPNFPRFFWDFSCFISWETETTKNSPEVPAIFECQIPSQIWKNSPHKFPAEQTR